MIAIFLFFIISRDFILCLYLISKCLVMNDISKIVRNVFKIENYFVNGKNIYYLIIFQYCTYTKILKEYNPSTYGSF